MDIDIRLGKPIDILSLKQRIVGDFSSQVERIKDSRTKWFDSSALEEVPWCPICGAPTRDSKFRLNVYGGLYHQCLSCSHVFVIRRPSRAALRQFYSSNEVYASTYTDGLTHETRVWQVAIPKAEWVAQQFERLYGHKPRLVLDIGAGMGHFVEACKRLGLEASGVEMSRVSRGYCKGTFGFDLEQKNWETFSEADVITFWGVLEHASYPIELLRRAHRILSGRETLVVAEVPRWNCLSTVIQKIFPNSIVRHLDPLGHIHCFTDWSLVAAFEACRFTPTAKWYFGMDAYELVMQLTHFLGKDRVIRVLGKGIPFLQNVIDNMRFCDEIVLAGRPL